jgi:hypothetical protein
VVGAVWAKQKIAATAKKMTVRRAVSINRESSSNGLHVYDRK